MAIGIRAEQYTKLYGIFIGIERFPQSNGRIKNLLHANEDADVLCNFFLENCQIKKIENELTLFTNEGYKTKTDYSNTVKVENGIRVNILKTLTNYIKEAKANDLLLVFISTHGETDYNDYFFIPSDGDIDNILGTGISSSTLIQALSKVSAKDVKVLMIIDTCFSGAISFDITKYKGEFSCLLSSSPVEYSYEFLNNDIEHGIFTYYLIEGLKGEASENSNVSLVNLFDYVYKNVQKETEKRQNPLLIGTMNYNFDITKATKIRDNNIGETR